MTDLADVLTPPDDPDAPITRPIDAQWAIARLAVHEADAADIREQAAKMRADVDDWEERELARIAPKVTYRRSQLEAWALRERDETGRATFDLARGTVRTVSQQARLDIADKAALEAWLDANNVHVYNEPTISKTKLVKLARIEETGAGWGAFIDGERVEGVQITPPRVSVTITAVPPGVDAADPIA